MANRLKFYMPRYISANQNVIVKYSSIFDSIILTSGIFNSFRYIGGNKAWMAMKIDFKKAYDQLEWDFIFKTFEDLGLNNTWIKRLKLCITFVFFEVLFNESPSESFVPSRGIRQGDSLSPYLFITCIGVLSRMINYGTDHKIIKGFKVCRGAPMVIHNFYVDDIVSVFLMLIFEMLRRLAKSLCRGLQMQLSDKPAKTIWRIACFNTSAVSILLKDMYIKSTSFWVTSSPNRASWCWRSILKGKELIKGSLKLSNGCGDRFDVWQDNWCNDEPLVNLLNPDINSHDPLRVADLIDAFSNDWNLNHINDSIPGDIIFKIKVIHISISKRSKDKLVWPYSRDGQVSLKDCYS
ncbi:uncharacterized protein LOC113305185 [Papaver somniferum]|uniref:uncharacterized protein LOC113305185 n=1 Tax=Papaver somniferum TaxID=3469 RepID=UPI000E6F5DF5|nr:uncharacterized protein LOC113305185 [Papaver somniferum]